MSRVVKTMADSKAPVDRSSDRRGPHLAQDGMTYEKGGYNKPAELTAKRPPPPPPMTKREPAAAAPLQESTVNSAPVVTVKE